MHLHAEVLNHHLVHMPDVPNQGISFPLTATRNCIKDLRLELILLEKPALLQYRKLMPI
jgi:hypothetical protein